MIAVRNLTTADEVFANAKRVRDAFFAPRQVVPTRVAPAPEKAAVEPTLAHETRQECEKFRQLREPDPSAEVVQGIVERDIIDLNGSLLPKAHARSIVRSIALRHKMHPEDIMGRGRTKAVVAARHDAIAAIYVKFPHWSLETIAQFFGVHHTSVLHAVRKRSVWQGVAA